MIEKHGRIWYNHDDEESASGFRACRLRRIRRTPTAVMQQKYYRLHQTPVKARICKGLGGFGDLWRTRQRSSLSATATSAVRQFNAMAQGFWDTFQPIYNDFYNFWRWENWTRYDKNPCEAILARVCWFLDLLWIIHPVRDWFLYSSPLPQ